jgi:AraC family transcriptional regulator
MIVRDDTSLRLARSHIDADDATARLLLDYHLSESEIAGFHSTETFHPPGFQIPRHFHDFASLYLVLAGSLTESYCGKKRECTHPSVIFTPPGEKHSNRFNDRGGRCFLVEIPPAYFDRLASAGIRIESSLQSDGGLLAWLGMKIYREFRQPDAVSLLAVEGLVLDAMSELARLSERPAVAAPAWLRHARDLLRDRFSECLLLDEIASSVGVHPSHLARSFRRCYGATVGEYQRRLRVEYAARQLSETRTSILSIAMTAGFADQAHFSRTFRNHTGLTPARFRANFGAVKSKEEDE